MTGSTKQIEWALKIQAQFIKDVREQQARNAAAATKAGQLEQWNAAIDNVVAQAEGKQDAAWWIDNRQHTSMRGQIFRDMYTAALAEVTG